MRELIQQLFSIRLYIDNKKKNELKVSRIRRQVVRKKYRKNIDFGIIFGNPDQERSRKTDVEKHLFF